MSKKIMVARYRFIGDTILSIPFLTALRKTYPDAEIHYWVGKDAYDLMQRCPQIDQAICFEPRELGFWESVKRIKQQKYDTVYLLKRSFSSALMTTLAGIPNRIGFNTEHRGLLLTRRIPYREFTHHEAQCFLDLLSDRPLEDWDDLDLTSWLTNVDTSNFSMGNGPHMVLHVTSTNPAKCWPLSHFETLARQLLETYGGTIYALGTEKESAQYEKIRDRLPDNLKNNFTNWCGKTTLVESIALLKNMNLVVANDSGMIHMAAAVNTPTIALFGPSDPIQWFPLNEKVVVMTHPNLACQPCRMKISCHHQYPCLVEITPEQVFKQCQTFL